MNQPEKALDVIIVGGGPAGLSAALWCRDLDLDAVLLEGGTEVGGQLLWTHNKIENLLGVQSASGRELRDKFVEHLRTVDLKIRTNCRVVRADLVSRVVTASDGTSYSAKAMIIATGVRRRALGVAGEAEFQGRGVLSSGVGSRDTLVDKQVLIVGGGDAAIENALLLSEKARSVTLVHRRQEFTARGELVDKARTNPTIKFLTDSVVRSINGQSYVTSVEVSNVRNAQVAMVEADAVLIRIGVQPNTEMFRGHIELDRAGYIKVDHSGSTRVPGVFAAGDVASPLAPTISTAVGGGAAAAKAIRALLDGRPGV